MAETPQAPELRKLDPKLRMIADGDTEVNVLRAELSGSVAVTPARAEKVPVLRGQESIPASVEELPAARPPGRLDTVADASVSVFVQLEANELNPRELPSLGRPVRSRRRSIPITALKRDLATAELPLSYVLALRERDRVRFIELGQALTVPSPRAPDGRVTRPSRSERSFGDARVHHWGAGVLVGLVDVGGFDFAHPEFLHQGKTRFVSIWDQGGSTRPSPGRAGTAPFDYGAELHAADMDRAITAASQGGLPAHLLEPQSQMSVGSHGTHVASIAAGDHGVCRRSPIAAVLVSIPEDELERRQSFYDSTRLAHAVDYLIAVADELGLPVVINISLGTNGHAHDDSSAINRWIDRSLLQPGRCVCVAAGNAGQERAETEGDIGFVLGRVHTSGRVPARELTADLEWSVVGNGKADLSENELEIWYGPQDRFSVQVKPPGGVWTQPVQAGEFIENRQLTDGCFLSVYNELYHPANGNNLIAIYLSPDLRQPVVGVTAGEWLVRLRGEDIRDGSYHAWIERDDPRRVGRIGERDAWVFPSFFSERSYVDKSTISSLGCGPRIIAVANLDSEGRRINITSSQGPTRDGREKPDIAAPGTDIVAAKGFAGGNDRWLSLSGTSMASPFVTGVTGLMLAINPALSAAQIGGIIRRTANPLPGADFAWRDDAGAGQIDAERCLAEAATMRQRRDVT